MSDTIKLEIGFDKIQIALEKAADDLFKNSYDNPIRDILKKSIQEKEGEVKKIVDEIVVSSINSPDFKAKIADVIIQRMVEASLKK